MNNDLTKILLDSAQNKASQGASFFNETQKWVNEEIVQGLHNLSYFSAGTISISITFLGYLIGQGDKAHDVLTINLFCNFKILWVLFISWGFLFITLLIGLLARFSNAWYRNYEAAFNWLSLSEESEKHKIKYMASGGTIVSPTSSNQKDVIQEIEESKNNYSKLAEISKRKKGFYLDLTAWSRKISILCFILGMLLLLVFVILSVVFLLRF
jgi:hypothetical protein